MVEKQVTVTKEVKDGVTTITDKSFDQMLKESGYEKP